MTVAAEPIFLDTNVLVYASVDASPFHVAALNAIDALEQSTVQI
jgi:predicted nucleic acid-binding protein